MVLFQWHFYSKSIQLTSSVGSGILFRWIAHWCNANKQQNTSRIPWLLDYNYIDRIMQIESAELWRVLFTTSLKTEVRTLLYHSQSHDGNNLEFPEYICATVHSFKNVHSVLCNSQVHLTSSTTHQLTRYPKNWLKQSEAVFTSFKPQNPNESKLA